MISHRSAIAVGIAAPKKPACRITVHSLMESEPGDAKTNAVTPSVMAELPKQSTTFRLRTEIPGDNHAISAGIAVIAK
jgi:hypothetical protein